MLTNEQKRQEIEKIAKANGSPGRPTARMIAETVMADPDHPLRPDFTDNPKEAALKCWVAEARRLLNIVYFSVKVEQVSSGPLRFISGIQSSPAYVRDPEKVAGEEGYSSVTLLAKKPKQIREEALRQKAVTIATFVRNGRLLALQWDLVDHFEEVLSSIFKGEGV